MDYRSTPLIRAIKMDDMEMVQFLLENGADPNLMANNGESSRAAIHVAAHRGNLEMVKKLAEFGADLNSRAFISNSILPVLCRAVGGSSSEVVNYLLDSGVPINLEVEEDLAPALLTASTAMDAPMVKLLISRGAAVDAGDFWGSTALMEAAMVGCLPVMRVLVEEGKADLNKRNNVDATALDEALRHDMYEAARYLWLAGGTSSAMRTSGGVTSAKWIRPYIERGPSARYQHGLLSIGNSIYMSSGNGLRLEEDKIYRPDVRTDRDYAYEVIDFVRLDLDQFEEVDWSNLFNSRHASQNSLNGDTAGDRLLLDEETELIATLESLADNPDAAFELDAADASNIKANMIFEPSDKLSYYEVTILKTCVDGCIAVGLCPSSKSTLKAATAEASKLASKRGAAGAGKIVQDFADGLMAQKSGMSREDWAKLKELRDLEESSDYLPGWKNYTFGYHSDDGHTFGCNGYGLEWGMRYDEGDIVGCGIVWETREVFFTLNGKFLGVAYHGLELDSFYACVGLRGVSGKCQVNFGASPFAFDFKIKKFSWRYLPTPPIKTPAIAPHHFLKYENFIILISRAPTDHPMCCFNLKTSTWSSVAYGPDPHPHFTPSEMTYYTLMDNVIYAFDPRGIGSNLIRIWSWTISKVSQQGNDNLRFTRTQILPTMDRVRELMVELGSKFSTEIPAWTNYVFESESTVREALEKEFASNRAASSSQSESHSNMAKGSGVTETTFVKVQNSDDNEDEHNEEGIEVLEEDEEDEEEVENEENLEEDEEGEEDEELEEYDRFGEIGEEEDNEAQKYHASVVKHLSEATIELDSPLAAQQISDYFSVSPVIGIGRGRVAFISITHVGIMDLTKKTIEVSRTAGAGPASLLFSTCLIKEDLVAVYGGWDQFCQRTDLLYLDLKRKEWYTAHTYGITPRPRGLHRAVPITLTPDSPILSSFVSPLDYTSLSLEEAKKKRLDCMLMSHGFSGRAHLKDLEILVTKMVDVNDEEAGQQGWVPVSTDAKAENETSIPPNSIRFDIKHPVQDTIESIHADAIVMASRSAKIRELVKLHNGPGALTISVTCFPHLFKSFVKFLWDDDVDFVYHHDEAILFHQIFLEWAPEHENRVCEALLMERLYLPSRWSTDLIYAFNNPSFSDITLRFEAQGEADAASRNTSSAMVVNDETSYPSEIKAHRCVLLRRNEYFRQLFGSGLAESNADVLSINCTPKLGIALIKSVYTESIVLDGLEDDIGDLLALADKYRVLRLKAELEQILAYNLTVDNVVSIFELSHTYNAATVLEACCVFLKQHHLLELPELQPYMSVYKSWEASKQASGERNSLTSSQPSDPLLLA